MLHFKNCDTFSIHHSDAGGTANFIIWHPTRENDEGFPEKNEIKILYRFSGISTHLGLFNAKREEKKKE